MLHLARTSPVARLAAAALALVLSGAPRALAAGPHAPAHRCRCPAGAAAHACECPVCARAAAAARAEGPEQEKLPPCHRAAARAAAARAAEEARRGAPSDAPCLRSGCGQPDGDEAAAPAADVFLLSTAARPARVDVFEPRRDPRARAAKVGRSPDVPPPRALRA